MSNLTSEEYAEKGGVVCPKCQSEEIHGDRIDIDEGYAYQRCYCTVCNTEWTDEYKITGYNDLFEEKKT